MSSESSFFLDASERYADKVTPAHKMAMQVIGLTRQMLEPHRELLERLVDAEQRMHSIGAIFDPTLYRHMLYSKNFALQLRMARSALAFLKEIDAIAKEFEIEFADGSAP